jgi:molybdate transport system substrate-binding protein
VNKQLRRSISIALAFLTLIFGLLGMIASTTPAQSPELHAMVSDGMKTVVEELTPQIEHATGRKLSAQFNSSKNLRDKIQGGEPFDVVIITSDVLDALIQQGKVAAAGRAEISRTGIGMGVRAGTPKPDISSPEALKKTFLSAKSITFNPSGASAPHTFDMFARMGITDVMKPKLMLDTDPGQPQRSVAAGKSELVVSLIPEIQFFPGVDLVGPIPAEYQSYINFSGGISANAKDAAGAKALLAFITSPAVVPVLKAKGMEAHK